MASTLGSASATREANNAQGPPDVSAPPTAGAATAPGADFLLVDADGIVRQASSGAAAILGLQRTTLLGGSIVSLLPCLAGLLAAKRPGASGALPVDTPMIVKDCPVPCGVHGTARLDIEVADLPQVDMALVLLKPSASALGEVQSNDWHTMMRRLQAVVDLSPQPVWIAEDDTVVFANRAAARLVGSERPVDIVGRPLRSLIRPDAHDELHRQMTAALKSPGVIGNLSAALLHAEGPARTVEIALTALPDHGHTTVQMVMYDVTRRQAEVRELERSRQALRRLSANIVEGREAERQRIARELHDELGQSLLALKMDLSACETKELTPALRRRLHDALAHLDGVMTSVRRIAADLRPLMLDELGPGPAIEWLVNDFARRNGLKCVLHLSDIGIVDDQQTAITLYRMVQEALTNVRRHARATEIVVELSRRDGDIELRVSDNGVGLPVDSALRDTQFGLLGMRERADMLGGDLILHSTEGAGTSVLMRIPLRSRARQRKDSSKSA